MKDDKSAIYLGFISDEYEELKHSLSVESFKRGENGFDEDIFHDTILKCVEKIKFSELTKPQVINYVFVSYNTNVLREKEYARNKFRDKNEVTEEIGGYYEDNNWYDEVIELAIVKFGQKDVDVFLDWCDGASIRELNERDGVNNYRYRLEKIREFIKNEIT